MTLPPFETLKANYPNTSDPEAVLRLIGGATRNEWWHGKNTCVLRMSRAFNYAGRIHELPAHHHGLKTVHGADHKNYAYRVAQFIRYLRWKYGEPDVVSKQGVITADPFNGKKGVIAWNVKGWGDATGHFTLWDGQDALYLSEFAPLAPGVRLTSAELWICS
jgi:hypothetical protein